MKFTFLFFFVLIGETASLQAQSSMPSYKQVIEKFCEVYAIPQNAEVRLLFAKKKEGWFVQLYADNLAEMEENALFWSVETSTYIELPASFRKSFSGKGSYDLPWVKKNIKEYAYSFERCPYFGYKEWREDVKKDFEHKAPGNDTLLDVMGHVYSTPAHYSFDYDKADSLPVETKAVPLPLSSVRDSIKQNFLKGIAYYRQLADRNPGFKTETGTISSTLFIEQMYYYLNLQLWGEEEESRRWIEEMKVGSQIMQIGYNYLNNCAPNSILFMKDPEEMFPALYVQEKEAFRNDVAIVSLKKLDGALYLQWLKKKKNILFRTPPHIYGSDDWLVMVRTTRGYVLNPVALFINDFFEIIEKKEQPYVTETGAALATFAGDRLSMPIDTNIFRRPGVIFQSPDISWRLPPFLSLEEYLVFDIIYSNFPKRPIHFSRKNELNMDFYLGHENFPFALSPDKGDLPGYRKAMELETVLKNYKPVLNTRDSIFQYYPVLLNDIHTRLYYEITQGYVNSNIEKARLWCRNYLASLKKTRPGYSIFTSGMAISLMRSGYNKEGIELLEKVAEDLVKYQRETRTSWPELKLSYSLSKEASTAEILKDYLSLLTARKLDSKKLRDLIKEEAQLPK